MQADKLSCRPWQGIVQRMAFSTLAVAALLSAGAADAAMYRWVDSNGRVHYSDTLPPTYQKSGASEMNRQGLVIKRTQSEAERRAEAERLAEEKRLELEQQQQVQQDRALTQTYTTSAEIDLARDRALEHHKLLIKSAEARAKAVDANLADLKARIANIQKAGRPVNASIQAQFDQASRERLDLKRTILKNEEAMLSVRDKYDADKARFRELTGR